MRKLPGIVVVGPLSVMTAACMTGDVPARTGTAYSCSGGTELRVTYLRNGALVGIDGRRAIPFKQTPSNSGAVYESGAMRLARGGNSVTWNTAERSAPESCQVVNTIN